VSKQYHIKLNGKLISVSEEVYRAYKRPQWREKKQKIIRRQHEQSIEHIRENDSINQANLAQCGLDEIIIENLLLDDLHEAISSLNDDERVLIYALFYNDKSERDVAKEIGVSQNTVNYHKKRVIEKLRKILENNF